MCRAPSWEGEELPGSKHQGGEVGWLLGISDSLIRLADGHGMKYKSKGRKGYPWSL